MSKYRILYIESGDYLYRHTGSTLYLYSIYEILSGKVRGHNYEIYETATYSEAKNKLKTYSGQEIYNSSGEPFDLKEYLNYFEIIEVSDEKI